MKTFKELKQSLKISESEDGHIRLKDKDVEFDIDNVDVEDVLDTEADTFMMDEDAIDTIKSISKKKQAMDVKLKDGKSIKVDMQTANVILKVIDALNDKNKTKFTDMLGKSKANFAKAVEFSWGAVK